MRLTRLLVRLLLVVVAVAAVVASRSTPKSGGGDDGALSPEKMSDEEKEAAMLTHAEGIIALVEHKLHSNAEQTEIVNHIIDVVNLGARKDHITTFLDELFFKLQAKIYRKLTSQWSAYAYLMQDSFWSVLSKIHRVHAQELRDRYSPIHRGYDGARYDLSSSIFKYAASGDMARHQFLAITSIPVGMYHAVKGMWEMVKHPIQTAEAMYTMVVEYDQTSAAIKAECQRLIDTCDTDMDECAKMLGRLNGHIIVSLITPTKVIKGKDVLSVMKVAGKATFGTTKLYHYTSAAAVRAIQASNKLTSGSGSVFATIVPPSLIFSETFVGQIARWGVLGGRLDFAYKLGKLTVTTKAPFTHAVQFSDDAFRLLIRTDLETAVARAAKSILLQYGKRGAVQLSSSTRYIEAMAMQPSLMEAFLNGMGYVVVPVALTADQLPPPDEIMPDCSKKGVVCAIDRLQDDVVEEQRAIVGDNPYTSMYEKKGMPSLEEAGKALECCGEDDPTCCGLI